MLLDRLENAPRYAALHPSLGEAFAYLLSTDLAGLPPGRTELGDGRITVIVEHAVGRGREGAKLEAHRRYIDIQLSLAAPDVVGWRALSECREVEQPYDEAKDAAVFGDEPETWVTLSPGAFVLLFPEDAHAPLATEGALYKVVVKVRVR
jgi:biofilm protein TabA